MQNQIQNYNFQDTNDIRCIYKDGIIWFIAKDICEVLDIKNTTQAINKLEEDERSILNIGRQGDTNIINESGMYTLILKSRKKEAITFRKWITGEVIPSIINTGKYEVKENIQIPKTYAEALLEAGRLALDNEKLQLQIEEDKPKVEFASAVLQSDDLIDFSTFAKILNIQGMGRNNILKFCKEKGILRKNNEPYQNFAIYFKVVETQYKVKDIFKVGFKTCINQKGVDYLLKKIKQA